MNFEIRNFQEMRLYYRSAPFAEFFTIAPQPLEKAVRALDAFVGPFERAGRRRGEDDEEARGVGAVLLDQVLRVDAVVLRLRHGAQAVVDHLAAVLRLRRQQLAPAVARD